MAVTVRVPARIRVDPAALTERRDLLEEALAAAAGRALGKAGTVLAENAPAAAVRLHPPETTWYGDALAEVPAALRAEVESAVAAVLEAAATSAGVAATATARGGDRAVLSEQIAEPFDPARYSEETDTYLIPAYQRGGEPTIIPLKKGEGKKKKRRTRKRGRRLAWRTARLSGEREFKAALAAELARKGRSAPEQGQLGVIARLTDGMIYAAVFQFPDGAAILGGPIGAITTVRIDKRGRLVRKRVRLPAAGAYRLSRYADGEKARDVAKDFFGALIRDGLRHSWKRPETWTAEEALQKQEERVSKHLEALTRDLEGNECFLELKVDGNRYLLVKERGGDPVPQGLDAELIPLTRVVKARSIADDGKGQGTALTGAGEKAGGERALGGDEGTGEGAEPAGTEAGQAPEAAAPTPEVPGFVSEGAAGAEAEAGRAFPKFEGGVPVTLECNPYEGEPTLSELGPAGEQLGRLLEQIAYRLQIQRCDYPGRFLLNAAVAMNARAWAVGLWEVPEAAATRSVAPGSGNFGAIDLHPAPSAQVELLRHLAGITPLIRAAADLFDDALTARPDLIKGVWQGRASSWTLRFWGDLGDGMREAVGIMFLLTCRVVFLQLLNASRTAIEARLANLDAYARHFEAVVVPYLLQVDDLTRLRDALRRAPAQDELTRINRALAGAYLRGVPTQPATGAEEAAAPAEPGSWTQATHAVVESMAPAPPTGRGVSPAPRILRDGGRYRIRDHAGRVWDLDGLERAIMLTRGTAESFEPLVKQLVELDEVVERFRDPDIGVKAELKRVLEQMWLSNWQIATQAKGSTAYAFRAGRISKDLYQATVPYTRFALSGIHLQAHLQIGEFFRGDAFYGAGLDRLLGTELGRQELLAFVEFAALTLLAVLCPPLAVVAGIGTALYHYGEALEKEQVYQALIDPELVITRAEVEAELFAAQLGLALSFLPVVPKIVGAARAAFRGAGSGTARAAGGLRGSVTRATAGMADDAVRHLMKTLEDGLIGAVAKELAEDWAAEQVLSLTLAPIQRALEEEWGITGPIGGLDRALTAVLERAERRRRAKAVAATGGEP